MSVEVLLINPPWLTRNGSIWHGVRSTSPPLGLLHVAAYAESRGHSVFVMDVNAEGLHFEDVERFVGAHKPTFVGLTAVTVQAPSAHRIAEIIKRVSPDSTVVIGGVHATALPDETLEDSNIDLVISGEGEKSFTTLIEGRPPESIPGLSYRGGVSGEPVEHNPPAPPIQDLDSLPTPAYHLVRFEAYKPAIGAYRRLPAISMTMTRGCPGKCTFCASAETALRARSAEHVVNEIQELQARYGIREVSFYDDTLTIFKKNVAEMCDLIRRRGIDLTWSCFARTDCVSPALLTRMRDAGCHQILFGIESADPQILKNIRKPIDIDLTRKAVRMVQDAGIAVRAAFMLGNPGETVQSIRRTIDFAKELNPDIAVFNITMPYPGTQLFTWARQRGYLRTFDWSQYELANAVLELPTISSAEIDRMYAIAYREFYFRFRYMFRRLLGMRSFEDVKINLLAMRSVLSTHATTAPDETSHEVGKPGVLKHAAAGRQPAPSRPVVTTPGELEPVAAGD